MVHLLFFRLLRYCSASPVWDIYLTHLNKEQGMCFKTGFYYSHIAKTKKRLSGYP